MKTGDVLTAINPCKMESSERATLTIGKKYIIKSVDYICLTIIDDDGDEHDFIIDTWEKFFVLDINSEIYY